jgi:hypothetical protein
VASDNHPVSALSSSPRYKAPPAVITTPAIAACRTPILPAGSGRIAVRRILPSILYSSTSLSAAVPPATKPIPSSACNNPHENEETPDRTAPK